MDVVAVEMLSIQFNAVNEVMYTNYKGETERRRIIPRWLFYGTTPHHPEPQWIVVVRDMDRGGLERHFALSGIKVGE